MAIHDVGNRISSEPGPAASSGKRIGGVPLARTTPAERYRAWNDAIAEHFFNSNHAGRPVYLQLDLEAMIEIGEKLGYSEERAEDSFLVALRTRTGFERSHPFAILLSETRSWRIKDSRAEETPPFLCILGATVLAASQMERDDDLGIASHNYYARLNDLLGYDGRGQPPDFDKTIEFWEDLRTWLDEDNSGKRGFCTAETAGGFRYIGRPLSQCLLRDTDRRSLPEFYRAAGIAPRSELTAGEILSPLISWCRQASCPLPDRTRRKVLEGTDDARQQIAALIANEARLWGGELIEAGSQSAPIVLQFDPVRGGRDFRVHMIPRRPPGFPIGGFVDQRNHHYELSDSGISEWYSPIPSTEFDFATVLASGLELRRGSYCLRWEPQPVIVAERDDIELGQFISRLRIQLGQRSLIVSRKEQAPLIEHILQEHAAPGWRKLPGGRGLPASWCTFVNVTLTSAPPHVPEQLQSLVPLRHVALSLRGGLRLNYGEWLSGAEPHLIVAGDLAPNTPVQVNGSTIGCVSAPMLTIDLRELDLATGSHMISVAGRQRAFRTITADDYNRSRVVPAASSTLGYKLIRHGTRYHATAPAPTPASAEASPGEVWVIGAQLLAEPEDLPENLAQPVRLESGARRYFLLGPRPGMVVECRDPTAPDFACLRTNDVAPPFTVEPRFPVVWLVRVSWRGRYTVRRIGAPLPVGTDPWREGDSWLWKRLIRKRYQRPPRGYDGALWETYVKAGLR